jgi:hypothetical protein
MVRGRLSAIAAFVMLIGAGCGAGPEGGSVKLADAGGTVTFKGSPVAGATVTFVPEKGPIATATTDLSGKFKLHTGTSAGTAVGKCKVSVVAMEAGAASQSAAAAAPKFTKPSNAQDMAKQNEDMKKAMMGATSPETQQKPKSIIPEKYADSEKSGLAFTVDADASKNDFTIALTE